MKEALESGKVGGAAVDVISREPAAADNPLLKAPKYDNNASYRLGSQGSQAEIDGYHRGKHEGLS